MNNLESYSWLAEAEKFEALLRARLRAIKPRQFGNGEAEAEPEVLRLRLKGIHGILRWGRPLSVVVPASDRKRVDSILEQQLLEWPS